MIKKIAVIGQNRNFLGAQIVHIPLFRALKNEYKNSEIILFSKSKISSKLISLGDVDRIIIEKTKLDFLSNYIKISPDITINLRKSSSFYTISMILFNRGKKIGFSGSLSNLFFHITKESNTKIYRANNYLSLIDKPMVYKKRKKKKRVIIIPGAGGPHKIWDIKNYINLSGLIKKSFSDFEIVFILGNKEKNFVNFLENYKYYINRDLKKLFAEIEESYLVITNDCGPSHIAQISDVKRISILSDERNDANGILNEWINTDEKTTVIKSEKGESINTIEVDKVYEKAYEILENCNL